MISSRTPFLITVILLVLATAVRLTAQNESSDKRTYVTNLGRTILAKANIIATGTISQNVKEVGTLYQRTLVVDQILWGNTKKPELEIYYTDGQSFAKEDQKVIVALTAISGTTNQFNLLGARIALGPSDDSTLGAVRDYITLDSSRSSEELRIDKLHTTLQVHLSLGGLPAQFAAVELLFLVKHYPYSCSKDRYLLYKKHIDSENDDAIKEDISTALRGMISENLKGSAIVSVMRGESDAERKEALADLAAYFKAFPKAFESEDAERIRLVSENLDDTTKKQAEQLAVSIEKNANDRRDGDEEVDTGDTSKEPAAKEAPDETPTRARSPFVAPQD